MPVFRLKVTGKLVPVPEGLGLGGAQDFLLQQGIPREELGLPEASQPDQPPGGEAFNIGMGKTIADRSQGLIPNETAAPPGFASALGQMAPAIGAGLLVPGAGWAGIASQAGMAGGLEALREGSTPGSVGGSALLGAAGTAVGNMAGRVVSGIGRAAKAALRGSVVAQTDDALRLASEGTGGGRIIEAINRRATNRAAAASIYQDAADLSPEVLGAAADDIGRLFDDALPDSYDATKARELIEAIPGTNLPGKAKLLALTEKADSFKELHRVMRDKVRLMQRSPELAPWADELDDALTTLTTSAKGGDPKLLTRAREGWKNLRNLESIADVVDTGNVPVGRAARTFSSETKGYGTSYKRGGKVGTQPETQKFVELIQKQAAAKGRPTSGTAERLGATTGILAGAGIIGGVVSGELSMEDAAKLIAAGAVISPALAAASVGTAGRASGATGSVLAQKLAELLKEQQATSPP